VTRPRFTDDELDYLTRVLIERVGTGEYVQFRDRKGHWHDFCPDCKAQLSAEFRGHAGDCPQALRYSVRGTIEAGQERRGEG
jgi:hypothetical protein